MELREFFSTVITSESGWFCLSWADADYDAWHEEWYGWPDDIDRIVARVEELREGNNVFFSPFLFKERQSIKENVVDTRTIAADLDEANLLTVPIKPTVLIESSPERHQGYWILKTPADDLKTHEELSKRLTYAIPRCDRTGWFLGKKLRVPTTYNYKYTSGRKTVQIIAAGPNQYDPLDFDLLPTVPLLLGSESDSDEDWIDAAEAMDIGPQELLATLTTKLPNKVVVTYDRVAQDRSASLWALMTSAFRAGASREQVYHLARHSANNKFAELRYGGRRELARDVLRAEAAVASKTQDQRTRIQDARRLPGLMSEKRFYIAQLIREHLVSVGQFIHCVDGTMWYIREDNGRPIAIMHRSENLSIMLDTMFGINSTEPESAYVAASLISYVSEMIPTGIQASMTHYDVDTGTLLLHTGRKDVLKITGEKVENVVNGYASVVFPWSTVSETLIPAYVTTEQPWFEVVFGDCLDNLTGLKREEAMALLRVWLVMLVMRNAVVSKPILALFGQPGAGKSTLFRRVYTLLYGKQRSLNAVTNADDFDYACSSDPLVVLDNVDTWERWLPDRLALAAASSEMVKRKLYTNDQVVTLKRQAFLGITAHNPKFGREDVTDRLILLTFERLTEFKPESDILDRIIKSRNALWGSIVMEVQATLASPLPPYNEVPQFRIEDFARVGYWIAKANGCGDDFYKAIGSLRREQRSFSLEEDHILLSALMKFVEVKPEEELLKYRTAAQWWTAFEGYSGDPATFGKQYKNAVTLGRKLWALMESLRQIVEVEWQFNPGSGSRMWRFLPKVQE